MSSVFTSNSMQINTSNNNNINTNTINNTNMIQNNQLSNKTQEKKGRFVIQENIQPKTSISNPDIVTNIVKSNTNFIDRKAKHYSINRIQHREIKLEVNNMLNLDLSQDSVKCFVNAAINSNQDNNNGNGKINENWIEFNSIYKQLEKKYPLFNDNTNNNLSKLLAYSELQNYDHILNKCNNISCNHISHSQNNTNANINMSTTTTTHTDHNTNICNNNNNNKTNNNNNNNNNVLINTNAYGSVNNNNSNNNNFIINDISYKNTCSFLKANYKNLPSNNNNNNNVNCNNNSNNQLPKNSFLSIDCSPIDNSSLIDLKKIPSIASLHLANNNNNNNNIVNDHIHNNTKEDLSDYNKNTDTNQITNSVNICLIQKNSNKKKKNINKKTYSNNTIFKRIYNRNKILKISSSINQVFYLGNNHIDIDSNKNSNVICCKCVCKCNKDIVDEEMEDNIAQKKVK